MVMVNGKEFSQADILALKELASAFVEKHDTSSTTPTAAPTHGPFPGNNSQFGPFSTPAVRPGMWNATPRVRSIAQYIPMFKSVYMNELIEVATGVTAGSGNNVVGACAVGPKPGQLKAAQIAATFGIIHESTKIFDITQAGMRRNRADVDREIYNQATAMNPWLPQVPGIDGTRSLDQALRAEFYALGIDLERNVSQVHFKGVAGTENNTYRGVARQWNGLDALIKTGWTDNINGALVPGLDAAVTSFAANIDGGSDVNSRNIIAALTETYWGQKEFLQSIGINPVFVLAMRPDLFRALAAIWACQFATTYCTTGQNSALNIDGESTRRMYLDLLNGAYLPMDGDNVQVVFDDTIERQTLGNNFYQSDIYGVALTGNGRPVIYGEYFDMGNPEAMEIADFAGLNGTSTVINGGLYRVFKYVTGGCVEYDFYARPRLITDAPFMHFRVDDLRYKSAIRTHDPIPGWSNYYNGGATYRL